jgi:hypothetical protein
MRPRRCAKFYSSTLPTDSPSDGLENSTVCEKKKVLKFLERAMLRPLADDFRPNKNGFR